ncbi:transcription antitermination factor NusB [Naasia lichenicola]|uniref:Transcription antitermination protein NusB n=1 Tax=Naasia lichenicola TaxID=2565933 RepID=A0A4S4FRY0_9MICO|nr:transcription antitermination factor NusB [Naasia lichenicola]THG33048.1 transcription antitermination factor NusB [Naasia lichenicola]
MSARSKARKRALDLLFAADVRDVPVISLVDAESVRAQSEPDRAASWRYARDIIEGIIDNNVRIDELISGNSAAWTIERMPAVDRAILRIGAWEILFNDEVPTAVAIDEAVEAAKELSTDDSAKFVHGVLAAIARTATPTA